MVMREAALMSLWTDKMTVTVKEPETEEKTGITSFADKVICSNEPCRVSFSSLSQGEMTDDGVQEITQNVKLFASVKLDIPPGSEVIVVRGGRAVVYESSGPPAFYLFHQEIPLKLKDKRG